MRRTTPIIETVVSMSKSEISDVGLVELFSDPTIIDSLYTVKDYLSFDDVPKDDYLLQALISKHTGSDMVLDVLDKVIIRRYIIVGDTVKVILGNYDLAGRALLDVNNHLLSRGYDQKYMIEKLDDRMIEILNNCVRLKFKP